MGTLGPVCLSWKDHTASLVANICKLFHNDSVLDAEIHCDGQSFRLHKVVLAASSSFFRRNLHMLNNAVHLEKIGFHASAEDVKVIIDFLYTGEVAVEEERLPQVQAVASSLGIYGLCELIRSVTHSRCSSVQKNDEEEWSPYEQDSVADDALSGDDNSQEGFCDAEDAATEDQNSVDESISTNEQSQDKVETEDNESSLFDGVLDSSGDKDNDMGCDKCCEVFASKELLDIHIENVHNSEASFVCVFCGFETSVKSSYTDHITKHRNGQLYVCLTCDKEFKKKSSLSDHYHTHRGNSDRYKCSHCVYSTLQKITLIKHLANKHKKDLQGNDLEATFKCPHCDFLCIANHKLKSHILRKHTVDKPHKCADCDYATVEKAALEKHKRIRHTHERPYVCEICGFRSHTISGSARHKRAHNGTKPYACSICGQMYADKKRLKDHMLKHANSKPFVCEVCGFACRRKDNLQAHMKKTHNKQLDSQALTANTVSDVPLPEEENVHVPLSSEAQTHMLPEYIAQAPSLEAVTYPQQTIGLSLDEVNSEGIPLQTMEVPHPEPSECIGFSTQYAAPSLFYLNNGGMHMGYYMTPAMMPQVAVMSGTQGDGQQQELILLRTATGPLVPQLQHPSLLSIENPVQ